MSGNEAVTIFVLLIIQIMLVAVYLTEKTEENRENLDNAEHRIEFRIPRGKVASLQFEETTKNSILSAGETFDYSGKYRIVRFFRNYFNLPHA